MLASLFLFIDSLEYKPGNLIYNAYVDFLFISLQLPKEKDMEQIPVRIYNKQLDWKKRKLSNNWWYHSLK